MATIAAPTAAAPPADADEIVLREALVIEPAGRSRRSAVHTDAVEARIVAGAWSAPRAGDVVGLPDGTERTWTEAIADENGWLKGDALRGGYAHWTVESERDRIMMLHARGHSVAYVNGEPRGGDPYNYGFVRLPVKIRQGTNDLLFRVGRGRLWARLVEPRAPVTIAAGDRTLPDLIVGEDWGVLGAAVIVNATENKLEGLTLAAGGDGLPTRETAVPAIPPLTVRKVPFWCGGAVNPQGQQHDIRLRLSMLADGRPRVIDDATGRLRVRRPTDRHQRTFTSAIDGSVQYYAVTPMRREWDTGERPALFLTLHGASVEGRRQAQVYRPKDWGHVVAPTNRRPYGFDWEDWGRLDAIEVLQIVLDKYDIDRRRVYLTGHSMGGHGVWHLGVTFPDMFAAIGPSAGWVSFFSYAGADRYEDPDPVEEMLTRATSSSDTLRLARNYLQHGVYVLHGEKDDNVPADQARLMYEKLGAFHPDLVYHEEPGAGHWWGDRCCDWPAMFEFFQARRRPPVEEVKHVEFVTASPGVSAWSNWLGIEAQVRQLVPASVVIDLDRERRRFKATTDNVAVLSLKLDHLRPGPIQVTIDGRMLSSLDWPGDNAKIWLTRTDDKWSAGAEPPSPDRKGPHRYGPFKDAFRHRVLFVYGTSGTDEENDWAYAKARYDAETFWYRGNAAVEVIADRDFDAASDPDRNVIIYGNAETNAAWAGLLGEGPVQVRRGSIGIGARRIDRDDLACLFIRPRPGSDTASVGVVCGSGPAGMRLTDRLPYFVSGVAYPDCTVIGPEMLSEGSTGVLAAGFFGLDWSVDAGDFAWRTPE
ncbi:MAG: carboxylesterase family protein [Planctomycetota bacterium]|jgi:poly(3-hydroxybutyrate) depolymerase